MTRDNIRLIVDFALNELVARGELTRNQKLSFSELLRQVLYANNFKDGKLSMRVKASRNHMNKKWMRIHEGAISRKEE
jgi:hypothetical protein